MRLLLLNFQSLNFYYSMYTISIYCTILFYNIVTIETIVKTLQFQIKISCTFMIIIIL